MELLDALATTRAIRRYTDDPIPTDDLSRILFSATRAPSGSNRQPFRFLVLRDGERAREARDLLGRSFRQQWDAMRRAYGYDEGSGAEADTPKARMAATMQHFVDTFEQTPVIVLACLEAYREADATIGSSIYPACQNLLLAARDLGYGGVLTLWHEPVADELHEVLGIPDDVLIAATIPVGRPQGRHGPVRRRPLGELVFEDAWEAPAPWAVDPSGTRHAGRPPS